MPGELDAVDEHRDQVDVVELARDELRELLGRRVDERARRVALARAARLDRRVHRLQAAFVAARGDAERDLLGDALGHRVAVAKRLDARQRDLSAPALAAGSNARMRQRHVTAAEAHRRRARAPVMVRAPFDVLALRPGDHARPPSRAAPRGRPSPSAARTTAGPSSSRPSPAAAAASAAASPRSSRPASPLASVP